MLQASSGFVNTCSEPVPAISMLQTHPILSVELAVVTTGMTEPVVKTEGLSDAEVWRQATVALYIGHSIS
jgi:hypothetical protein